MKSMTFVSVLVYYKHNISIHALFKGATMDSIPELPVGDSIHAPVKGCDLILGGTLLLLWLFQPTHP